MQLMIMLNRVLVGLLLASGPKVRSMAGQPTGPETLEPATFESVVDLLATLTADTRLEEFAAAIAQAFGPLQGSAPARSLAPGCR
jgi:hypothetical protein